MPGPSKGFLKTDAEIGALVGPDSMGQLLVVSGVESHDPPVRAVSYATTKDIEDARRHIQEHGPRSVTEATLLIRRGG